MVLIAGGLCTKMADADEVFFPEHGGNNDMAKELCYNCPMLDICRHDTLLDDLARREDPEEASDCWGVAGGLTGSQRSAIVDLLASDAPPATVAPSRRPGLHSLRDPRAAERAAKTPRLGAGRKFACAGCRASQIRCVHSDSVQEARGGPG